MIKRNALLIFVALFIIACEKANKQQAQALSENQAIYSAFSSIHLSLDFPGSPTVLKSCIEENLKNCMNSVNRVLDAKKQFLQQPKAKALATTLSTITKYCELEQNIELNEDMCRGAATALYYFTSGENDTMILSSFKSLSKTALKNIFVYSYSWYHNRPNKNAWRDFVNVSPLQEPQKTNIISTFESKEESKFGLMLLD